MLRKKLKLASSTVVPGDNQSTGHLNRNDKNDKRNENATASTSDGSDPIITSPFFELPFWQKLYHIECRLNAELKTIDFLSSTISAVYNPIEYAANLHCAYLKKFLNEPKAVLFIGMNPGPWGMVQTGVPFGYIPAVRDWLKLDGIVNKPEKELPARPVTGLLCEKAEQSGQRFWGLLQDLCGDTPEPFFRNCFIHNLCPLAFFHSTGRNLTPAELKTDKKKTLQIICMKYLKEAIDLISPQLIISIGRYTEDRIKELYKSKSINKSIGHKCMPHPSPRSLNNTNWNEKAKIWLAENDVMKYIKTN